MYKRVYNIQKTEDIMHLIKKKKKFIPNMHPTIAENIRKYSAAMDALEFKYEKEDSTSEYTTVHVYYNGTSIERNSLVLYEMGLIENEDNKLDYPDWDCNICPNKGNPAELMYCKVCGYRLDSLLATDPRLNIS